MSDSDPRAAAKTARNVQENTNRAAAEANYQPKDWSGEYGMSPNRILVTPDKAVVPEITTLRADAQNGDIVVDGGAIRQFAGIVEGLIPYCDRGLAKLRQVKVLPGNFYDADQIVTKVGTAATGGLASAYVENLVNLKAALVTLAHGLRDITDKYDSVETLNAEAGADISSLIADIKSELPVGAAMPGQTPTTKN
ncbi:hypothetical protein [Micromonospora sp. NBC_01412]|uniref:hypothetical protein n=1 Tax=Micromonospora sp. NBC_01412 TaxID=2903590 RepID=UPI0032505D4C